MYHGRVDNIIVFSNGEKLNPVTIEEIVMCHPKIKGVLVVGSMRFQPALLVEPTSPPKDKQEELMLLDNIWPLVVKANKDTVAHGQIGRQFIALTTPEKPFPRTGKGTIRRAETVRLYKNEIDELYEKAEKGWTPEIVKLDVSSEDALMLSIEKIFQSLLMSSPLEADTDFFTAGFDSMQVIAASRLLRGGLEAAGVHVPADAIATRVIYNNQTPRELAAHLFGRIKQGADSGGKDELSYEICAMQAQLKKYTENLPEASSDKPDPADHGQTVMITGTTGSLGSHLLDFMLSCTAVKKIICLNRAEDGKGRQTYVSKERGLSTNLDIAEFLHADLSRSDLGLSREDYDRLLEETDRIIHSQWPVNFNMSVESFEPHVRGVYHLVNFSHRATKRVPIIFVSSISTMEKWAESTPVPEKQFTDISLPTTGYGRSKLVSSLILDAATKHSQNTIPTATIRVGQVGGSISEKGAWNRQEWLPSIIASSVRRLGVLPKDLGPMTEVDWTPVEDIAKLVLEVSGVTERMAVSEINGYFHGVNPHTTNWAELADAVKEFYGDRIKKLVSFREWVDALEKSQSVAEGQFIDVDRNPAVKLLDFYRTMMVGNKHVDFEMKKTMKYSRTMREVKPVTPELMKHWCKQWGY